METFYNIKTIDFHGNQVIIDAMKDKKKTASLILCIVSNVMLVLSIVLIPISIIMGFMSTVGHNEVAANSFGFLILFGGFGFFVSLVLAIVAKCLNTKSIYGLICIVLSSIAVVLSIVAFIGVTVFTQKVLRQVNQMQPEQSYGEYSGTWEEEVQNCLNRYEFDSVDVNYDFESEYVNDGMVIMIYISRDTKQSKIDRLNDFVLEIKDISLAFNKTVMVYPCYFDRDKNLDYTMFFEISRETADYSTLITNNMSTSIIYAWNRPKKLPKSADECNILIVEN